jgi:hypothetical protein
MNRDSHLIFEAYQKRLVKEQDEKSPAPQPETQFPAKADIGPDVGPVQSNLDFPNVDDGYKTNLVYQKNKHARVENPIAQSIFEKLPNRINGSEVGEKIQQLMRDQEPPVERRAFMDILEALINGKAFYSIPQETGVEAAAEPSEQDVQDELDKLPAYQMAQRQARMENEN